MTDLPCKRPGCDFPRQTWTNASGKRQVGGFCCAPCLVWTARAKDVVRDGDEQAAAELLRLDALLSRRTKPTISVRGLEGRPKAV